MGGYADIEMWYNQTMRSESTHHQSYGALSPPSLYKAFLRLADGYPDPKTGKNTAISSALRRLPAELPTPPSFRKVNPADFPILFLALKSAQVRLSDIDAFATRAILPRISTLSGVAQVVIFGTQKYAVRVRADLDQLAVRGLTLNELQTAIVNANSTKPLGAVPDARQNAILDATGPINKASDYMPVVVAFQNGAPVRISDVATSIDSVENDKVASWLDGTRATTRAINVYRRSPEGLIQSLRSFWEP